MVFERRQQVCWEQGCDVSVCLAEGMGSHRGAGTLLKLGT